MSYESKNTLKKIILFLLLVTLSLTLIACNGETADDYLDEGGENVDEDGENVDEGGESVDGGDENEETPGDSDTTSCTHSFGSWITKSEPTCTEKGLQERVCEICNEAESRELPAIDHTYSTADAVWTWNDTESASAELNCINDSTHKLTLNATVTKTSNDKSCTIDACDVYTATVTHGEAVITDTVTVYQIGTAAHDYDEETASFSWNNDHSKATFTIKCKYDASHVYSEIVSAEISTVEASCENEGAIIYTAATTVGGKAYSSDYTVTQGKLAHTLDAENGSWSWSDDLASAEYSAACKNGCGHTETVGATVSVTETDSTCQIAGVRTYTATATLDGTEYTGIKQQALELKNHVYDFENAVWHWSDDFSAATVEVNCTLGNQHTDTIFAKISSESQSASCEDDGKTVYTATVSYLDAVYTDVKTVEVDALGHKYEIISTDWAEGSATAVITCKNDSAHTHTLTAPVTKELSPETCAKDGFIKYTAAFEIEGEVLTAQLEETLSAPGHNYGEDRKCARCGKYRPSEGLEFELLSDGTGYSVLGMGECTDSILVIPEEHNGIPVVRIAQYSFTHEYGITELHVPGSVKVIDVYAFTGCNNIRTLVLEEGVEIIGIEAFQMLYYLRELNLPESLTAIGTSAFAYCESLTELTLNENLESIGDAAFKGCIKLMEIKNLSKMVTISPNPESEIELEKQIKNVYTATEGAKKIYTDENGFVFYDGEDVAYLLSYHGDGTGFALPQDCNGKQYIIYHSAFRYLHSFSEKNVVLTIPDSVTQIGKNAFLDCDWLVMVNGGKNLTYIADFAFALCDELLSVTVGANVTKMGEGAFGQSPRIVELFNYSAISVSTLWIKTDLYAIHTATDETTFIYKDGDYFYFYDYAVAYMLRYVGDETELTLPENFMGVKYNIAPKAFDSGNAITKITVTAGVNSFEANAFSDCATLTEIVMSENAAPTAIGKFAFAGTSITEITIPESVKRIDRYAFPDTLENAYFESVENWYYTRFSGSSVSSSKLTDSKKAAEYVLNLGDYDMYVKE